MPYVRGDKGSPEPSGPRKKKETDSQAFKDMMQVGKARETDPEEQRKRKSQAESELESAADQTAEPAQIEKPGVEPSPYEPTRGETPKTPYQEGRVSTEGPGNVYRSTVEPTDETYGASMEVPEAPQVSQPPPAPPAYTPPPSEAETYQPSQVEPTREPEPTRSTDRAREPEKTREKEKPTEKKTSETRKPHEVKKEMKPHPEVPLKVAKPQPQPAETKATFLKDMGKPIDKKEGEEKGVKEIAKGAWEATKTTGSEGKEKDKEGGSEGSPMPPSGVGQAPLPSGTEAHLIAAPTTLPPQIRTELWDRMVGVMTVLVSKTATGKIEKVETFIDIRNLKNPNSVFNGSQILITEYGTAHKEFNIELQTTNQQAFNLFNENAQELVAAFNSRGYPFKVHAAKAVYLSKEEQEKRKTERVTKKSQRGGA